MSLGVWLYSVVIEATFEGNHSFMVQRGIRLGFILFVISEIMVFFSFFWAFFHSSLSPNVEVGCIWPPSGVTPINPFGLPLVNTVILLVSGASLTCSHNFLLGGKFLRFSIRYMGVTISLGILFTFIQIFEYCDTPINISSSSYGSSFFILTGFHGLHVLVGTIMLTVSLLRLSQFHFSSNHHLGLETAIWYWHFVDVVWLFLYVWVYWWGGNKWFFYTKILFLDQKDGYVLPATKT